MILMEKHMFLATVADGQTAASWGEGKENCEKLTPSLLLCGSSLGGPLGARWFKFVLEKNEKHFGKCLFSR